jgi:uncharacterized membrane protein
MAKQPAITAEQFNKEYLEAIAALEKRYAAFEISEVEYRDERAEIGFRLELQYLSLRG